MAESDAVKLLATGIRPVSTFYAERETRDFLTKALEAAEVGKH